VLDAAGHDEQVAGLELHVPIAQLDRQMPLQDQEEVVCMGMGVPDELSLRLSDLDLVPVVVPDDLRREDLVEARKLVGEANGLVHVYGSSR
jgi:hypothetical protein